MQVKDFLFVLTPYLERGHIIRHSRGPDPLNFLFRPPTYEGHIRPKLENPSAQVQQIGCDKRSHNHRYYGIPNVVKDGKQQFDTTTDTHHPLVYILELFSSLATLTKSRTKLGHSQRRVGASVNLPAL